MSEAASQELVIPYSGEIISFDDPAACARALGGARQMKRDLDGLIRELTAAIVHHAAVAGTKTLEVGGVKASVKGGSETVYDAEKIEAGLRRAGCPEDRIREIVKETVTYSVNAVEAKRAAAANPAYARVVKRHSRTVEKPSYVSVGATREIADGAAW